MSSLAVYTCPKYRRLSLRERCKLMKTELNKRIVQIMEKKRTCLCLAVDITKCSKIIQLVTEAAPYICALKLHADKIEDFTDKFAAELTKLAIEHEFVIFEDRKFSDTASIVELQATAGQYKINRWAHLVTVSPTRGQPVLDALRNVIQEPNSVLKGCLLVADFSTMGALTNSDSYRAEVFTLGRENRDIVNGFICQKRTSCDSSVLYWTSGVHLSATTDGSGQQWRGIKKAIIEDMNDIIIVGMAALTQSVSFEFRVIQYRDASWRAYNSSFDLTNLD